MVKVTGQAVDTLLLGLEQIGAIAQRPTLLEELACDRCVLICGEARGLDVVTVQRDTSVERVLFLQPPPLLL